MGLHGLFRDSASINWRHDGYAENNTMVDRRRHFHVYHVGGDDVRYDAAIGHPYSHDFRAGSGETRGRGSAFRSNWCFRGRIPACLAGVFVTRYHSELVATHRRFDVVNDGQGKSPDGRLAPDCSWSFPVDTT